MRLKEALRFKQQCWQWQHSCAKWPAHGFRGFGGAFCATERINYIRKLSSEPLGVISGLQGGRSTGSLL